MEWWQIQSILITLAVIVGVLVPVLGITYRFVLRGILKDRERLVTRGGTHEELQRDARLDSMERQIEELTSSIRRLAEVAEFDRQLKGGDPPDPTV